MHQKFNTIFWNGGNSHIFSIRDQLTGNSLSTVELRLEDDNGDGRKISVNQHYGHKNSAPSDECQGTLTKFLSYLRQSIKKERFHKIRHQRLEFRQQQLERQQQRSNKCLAEEQIRNEGFRKLLHGYTSLEEIGQKTSEVSAESRPDEKKSVEYLPCPLDQSNNSTIMKIIGWFFLLKNSYLHTSGA